MAVISVSVRTLFHLYEKFVCSSHMYCWVLET
jgi:hypothetical protein